MPHNLPVQNHTHSPSNRQRTTGSVDLLKVPLINYLLFANPDSPVVTQYYDTDVNKEYVIRGNPAVLKCQIPSFVADFVEVISWHTDQDETFDASETKFG